MVQPAGKKKEGAGIGEQLQENAGSAPIVQQPASNNNNKRQRSSSNSSNDGFEVKNNSKRHSRTSSSDNSQPPSSSSPSLPSKKPRGGKGGESLSAIEDELTKKLDADGAAIITLRENAISQKMELIKQLTEQKEREMGELMYLEAGGNMMDFDPALMKGRMVQMQVAKEQPPIIQELPSTTSPHPPRPPTPTIIPMVQEVIKKGPGRPSKESLALHAQQQAQLQAAALANAQLHGIQPRTPQSSRPPTPSHSLANSPVGGVYASPAREGLPAVPIPTFPPINFPSIFTIPASITDKDRELALKDAEIVHKVGELQRSGMWSLKRLPKAPEPPRAKVHWDHVLAEMAWLANDFKQERKWKMALAKKVSKQVLKYHHMLETREMRKRKEEEQHLRKIASGIAKEVKKFWQKIEKVVQYKEQTKADEKKKEQLDKQLDFLVGQTEKYFEMIAHDLSKPAEVKEEPKKEESAAETNESKDESMEEVDHERGEEQEAAPSHTQELLMDAEEPEVAEGAAEVEEDAEFVLAPEAEDVDDEATLEEEEKKGEPDDMPKGEAELSQLQRESEIPLDDLLRQFKDQAEGEADEEDVDDEDEEKADDDGKTGQERISEAAAAANAAQPTGYTLATTNVKTKVPFLLHGTLREYQHIGLDWLVTMYEKKLNGILADEMGLGKTIMTISMLAHLACEKGIWGPHLIVVPTSVMLNWEMEFKKWCPAFKILTYFGTQKERKLKRQGWSKTNSFHVCITSYKVVVQDQQAFRRKKWKYFILDEAHNIKNFRSQRWQVLLNFNSKRRLLLTGTPLQNSLMELWSLMHFLMPHMFQSHKEFKDWFSNPVTGMIEGTETLNEDLISRLHAVLRPFLLRRMKKDVEKQLPGKYSHVVTCQLSKRQRFLYEEFMSNAMTQETLKSGNFLGIINVLMQLRKVCNHPDLFEARPIISPFDVESIEFYTSSAVCRALEEDPFTSVSLKFFNLDLASAELDTGHLQAIRTNEIRATKPKIIELGLSPSSSTPPPSSAGPSILDELRSVRETRIRQARLENLQQASYINEIRCARRPLYGWDLRRSVNIHPDPIYDVHTIANDPSRYLDFPNTLAELVKLPSTRCKELTPTLLEPFVCIIPKARAGPPRLTCSHPSPSTLLAERTSEKELLHLASPTVDIFRSAFVRSQVYFPDKSLVQYDCGKLQQLDTLLRKLKSGGHRVLIFTQMTRMLDVLEVFLNLHGYTYSRLDGSTKVEKRQQLTERFNTDPKIFAFILSTRSGGVGINLTGADSVVFYDSDWNPAMDAQAQDRCHRIGQTRDVHIYRLVTEYTIEENILKKANQKRHLDDMVIKGGSFTTDFFKNVDVRDLFDATRDQIDRDSAPVQLNERPTMSQQDWESAVANAEDETDAQALRQAQAEQSVDYEEFSEETAVHAEGSQPAESQGESQQHDLSFLQQEDEEEALQSNGKLASSSGFSFEDSLLPIQRYALRFLETATTDQQEQVEEEPAVAYSTESQDLELENAKRLKEEEEERMSEDDELLFYEVVS